MNLITISNKYSIVIEEYEKIKSGDTFSSKNELLRKICHPRIEGVGGTEKRLLPTIDKIISYEKVKPNGNKIKIKCIEPLQNAKKIIEKTIKTTKIQTSRTVYKSNRDYLLDYVIFFANEFEDIPLYLTSSDIIKYSAIFKGFYYDYCNVHYDKNYSTQEEIAKLNDFIIINSIADKNYLVKTMDTLNDSVYEKFDKNIIFNWAKGARINAEKVLFQSGDELDRAERQYLEETYIEPLKDRGIPAKSIIRLANNYYMKDYGLTVKRHKWFYYTYKFTNPNNVKLITDTKDLTRNQKEINEKFIETLKLKAVDAEGNNYHKDNANNLEYIINNIKR